ncbi:MAG: hypothetical protein UV59_C0037G0001, partial [Candidatus Gottesmanbacteria bacterium GW2011_GWA1_43_11]
MLLNPASSYRSPPWADHGATDGGLTTQSLRDLHVNNQMVVGIS